MLSINIVDLILCLPMVTATQRGGRELLELFPNFEQLVECMRNY